MLYNPAILISKITLLYQSRIKFTADALVKCLKQVSVDFIGQTS